METAAAQTPKIFTTFNEMVKLTSKKRRYLKLSNGHFVNVTLKALTELNKGMKKYGTVFYGRLIFGGGWVQIELTTNTNGHELGHITIKHLNTK